MQPLVAVQDLDRVLDRDDVLLPRAVDVVDHRRERRRLPRAGRARDEDEAAVLVGEPRDAGRQRELVEASARRFGITRKANEIEPRWRKPLTRKRGRPSAWYAMSRSPVFVEQPGAAPAQRRTTASSATSQVAELERRRVLHRTERAVAPEDRRLAYLQVDVGRAEFDGAPEEGVEVHAPVVGTRRARLSRARMAVLPGGVPERPKGAVCKTAGSAYEGSNPSAPIASRPFPFSRVKVT